MESDLLEYNQTFSEFSNSSTDSEAFCEEEVESESIHEEDFCNQVPPSEPGHTDCMSGAGKKPLHPFPSDMLKLFPPPILLLAAHLE